MATIEARGEACEDLSHRPECSEAQGTGLTDPAHIFANNMHCCEYHENIIRRLCMQAQLPLVFVASEHLHQETSNKLIA